MIIPVTAVFAALTALLMLLLAVRVVLFRRRLGIGIGDGGDHDCQVAIRAHANLMEYAPIMLIMLAIGELNGVSAVLIYTVGMAFILGRFLHAWGFIRSRGGAHMGRMVGVGLNWLAMLAMTALLLINVGRVAA